eukprot:gene38473-46764_t
MQSLFPTNHGAAATRPPLIQFRAGKCELVQLPNGKYRVSADLRRGNISLTRESDGLVHFKWSNFVNGAVEDDRIVMAGDCTFHKVASQERVYLLKFRAGAGPRLMYWMQAKSAAQDEENVNKLNNLMNSPQAVLEALAAGGSSSGAAGAGAAGNDWMQAMLGGAGAGRPGAARSMAAAPSSSSGANYGQLDLTAIMNALNRPAAPAAAPAAAATTAAVPAVPATPAASSSFAAASTPAGQLTIDDLRRAMLGSAATPAPAAAATPALQDVLQPEEVVRSGVLDDPQAQAELLEQLPESQRSAQQLLATVHSPQLRQALSGVSHAVAQDPAHFAAVANNLGLDASAQPVQNALNAGDGVGALLAAVAQTHPPEEKQGDKKDADDDGGKMDE